MHIVRRVMSGACHIFKFVIKCPNNVRNINNDVEHTVTDAKTTSSLDSGHV